MSIETKVTAAMAAKLEREKVALKSSSRGVPQRLFTVLVTKPLRYNRLSEKFLEVGETYDITFRGMHDTKNIMLYGYEALSRSMPYEQCIEHFDFGDNTPTFVGLFFANY